MPDLSEFFESPPADLAAYFERIADGAFEGRFEVGVNLFPLAEAVGETRAFRSFHPVVGALQGVVLDDANTSNYHIYLSAAGCAGAVLYLNHDGDSLVVFPSLDAFLDAARESLASERRLTSFHPPAGVLLPDQHNLRALVERLLADGTGEPVSVIVTLIPSLVLADAPFLERLATDEDFFLGEAVGDAIAHRPHQGLKPIAALCAKHKHPQVVNAGKRALAAIAALK